MGPHPLPPFPSIDPPRSAGILKKKVTTGSLQIYNPAKLGGFPRTADILVLVVAPYPTSWGGNSGMYLSIAHRSVGGYKKQNSISQVGPAERGGI